MISVRLTALLALVGIVMAWQDVNDPRERMYLAPGQERTAPYIGKRATSKNGLAYPAPVQTAPSNVPQAWTDKYNTVKKAGLIPDLPVPKLGADGLPVYPSSVDDKTSCNWEATGCLDDSWIQKAPDGTFAIGLDDGPTQAVTEIGKILTKHNATISHFLIGLQALTCITCLQELIKIEPRQHLGSHSFTHLQLATLTDAQLVADLGWANQIIYDYSGYVPLYLRPPQGDVDYRVAAIAKHVYGMQIAMWNQDELDWCLQDGGADAGISMCDPITDASVKAKYKTLADANPQRGVFLLAHEIRNAQASPLDVLITELVAKKWKIGPITAVNKDLPAYQNAKDFTIAGANMTSMSDVKAPFNVSQAGLTVTLNADWTGGENGGGSGTNTSTGGGGTVTNTTAGGNSTTASTNSSSGTVPSAGSVATPTNLKLAAAATLGLFGAGLALV